MAARFEATPTSSAPQISDVHGHAHRRQSLPFTDQPVIPPPEVKGVRRGNRADRTASRYMDVHAGVVPQNRSEVTA
jgi:hypothetical protein